MRVRGSEASSVKIVVILLGTGTPNLKDDQWGPSTLVHAGGNYFLFDCGRGTLLRIKQAGVEPEEVSKVFLTHLHSDHVVGLPDLWLTGWEMGRRESLRLWGPDGTASMVSHLELTFSANVKGRQEPPQSLPSHLAGIVASEIEEGVIYSEKGVKVTCFLVDHGSFKPAFGFRVDYDGCSVVLSGDTRFSENLVKYSQGVEVLIHDAWVVAKDSGSVALQLVASPEEVAKVFNRVKPRLGVISHYNTVEGLAQRIRVGYEGEFMVGRDLVRVEIGLDSVATSRVHPIGP